MKYRYRKQYRFRKEFECREIIYYKNRVLWENRLLSLDVRYMAIVKRSLRVRRFSVSLLKNLCVLTGRSRGVLSDFKLSRIKLREMFSGGKIIGVRKAGW